MGSPCIAIAPTKKKIHVGVRFSEKYDVIFLLTHKLRGRYYTYIVEMKTTSYMTVDDYSRYSSVYIEFDVI